MLVKPDSIPTYTAGDFARVNYAAAQADFLVLKSAFNEFEIHRIEAHKDQIRFPLLPHRKTVHDFIFLTKGQVIRSKGLDSFTFQAGELFFLPAYTITSTEFVSSDAEGFYCHFSNDLIPSQKIQAFSFFDVTGTPVLSIGDSNTELLISLLARLLDLSPSNKELISLYIQLILTEIHQDFQPIVPDTISSAYHIHKRFKEALNTHIYTIQSVRGYAELLHISPNHLNKCIKKITGRRAKDWIGDMVVLEAKVLLRQTQQSVSEIALRLSGQDVSDFGRFFKNKTGFTPKEFRALD